MTYTYTVCEIRPGDMVSLNTAWMKRTSFGMSPIISTEEPFLVVAMEKQNAGEQVHTLVLTEDGCMHQIPSWWLEINASRVV